MSLSFSKKLLVLASLAAFSPLLVACDGADKKEMSRADSIPEPTAMGHALPNDFSVERYIQMNSLEDRFRTAKTAQGLKSAEIDKLWKSQSESWAKALCKRSVMGREAPYVWIQGAKGGQWRKDMLDPTVGTAFLDLYPFPKNGEKEEQWKWYLERSTHLQILESVPAAKRAAFTAAFKIALEKAPTRPNVYRYNDAMLSFAELPSDRWESAGEQAKVFKN